jgi:hypothetical protein
MENSKRFWTASLGRGFWLGAVALAGMAIVGASDARATNFKTLYSFRAQGGSNCTDGASPVTGVIKDAAGNSTARQLGAAPTPIPGCASRSEACSAMGTWAAAPTVTKAAGPRERGLEATSSC